MKKVLLFVFVVYLIFPFSLFSNPPMGGHNRKNTYYRSLMLHDTRWEAGLSLGLANSMTDVASSRAGHQASMLDVYMGGVSPAFSGYTRYRINRLFAMRGNFSSMSLRGNDNWSSDTNVVNRGKSFSNRLLEGSMVGELYYPRRKLNSKRDFNLNIFDVYVFTGVSLFHHQPMVNGPVIDSYDRSLQQEDDLYNNLQFAIPMGVGMKWTVSHRWVIGTDVNFRYTFFDFLDGFRRPYSTRNDFFFTTNLNVGFILDPPPYTTDRATKKNVFRKRRYSKGFINRSIEGSLR